MNRAEFIKKADEKLRLVRTESGYTQDKMAAILGLSKKTLVQVEKGRSTLGWAGAVTLSSIFRDSEVLQMTLGENPQDIILTLAFERYERGYVKTLGGKVWWKELVRKGQYKLQQNIISQHYRILDGEDRRISSSFDYEYITQRLNELY